MVDHAIRRVDDEAVATDLGGAGEVAAPAAGRGVPPDAAVGLGSPAYGMGLDRRPRVIADAGQSAEETATTAAADKSRKRPDPQERTFQLKHAPELLEATGAHRVGAAASSNTRGSASVQLAANTSPFTPDGRPPDLTPVQLLDDNGNPVLNSHGKPILRPRGVDPHFFVREAMRFTDEAALIQSGDATGVFILGEISGELLKFRQGRPWDLQRLGGHSHPEFVDIATVVIGLYGAAAGVPRYLLLSLQDVYGRHFSRFGKRPMDSKYVHLPIENVTNTLLVPTIAGG